MNSTLMKLFLLVVAAGVIWGFLRTPVPDNVIDLHGVQDETPDELHPRAEQQFLVDKNLRTAEEVLTQTVALDSGNVKAKQQLSEVLYLRSKFQDAQQLAASILSTGDFEYEHLLLASGARHGVRLVSVFTIPSGSNEELLEKARVFIDQERLDYAHDLLKNVLSKEPDHDEAQGWYGQILARQHSSEFAIWNTRLSAAARHHPEVWLARGWAARSNQNRQLATYCALKSLKYEPFHTRGAAFLASVLKDQGNLNFPTFEHYANLLRDREVALEVLSRTPDFSLMRDLATDFQNLGAMLLARAWAESAQRLGCNEDWPAALLEESRLEPTNSLLIQNLMLKFEANPAFRDFANLDWGKYEFKTEEVLLASDSQIAFRDLAAEVGLQFRYQNGELREFPLGHLFETTGGGLAALDYDQDGWSDLYLSQGRDWRTSTTQTDESNRIFRNLQGDAAQDTTAEAGLRNVEFSQGVAAGDFNNDGFPDLYVCQLGRNRFYENSGDGTFQDITSQTQTEGEEWSLSAGFADLNGDHLADLFVVNYFDVDEALKTPCTHAGQPRACPPTLLHGSRDRVYLNQGDGRFQDVSSLSLDSSSSGTGMGIVIADFTNDGQLEIFVGNDSEANSFWTTQAAQARSLLSLVDEASLRGVATDAAGAKQATMGIASGDVNEDGRLDLFVTNFYEESNTLYQQTATRLFEDVTATAGRIQSESRLLLGFGTQFLDADCDGDLDLFVANGHVDRSSVTGEPDHMRPSFFLNQGQVNFLSPPASSLGNYFERPVLGRAVATLDWNRDGLTDLCVTHLDQPVALLINQTPHSGNFIRCQVIATTGERDAIGARMTLRAGSDSWTHQITSGSGYAASNEQTLTFGIGSHQHIEELTVRWRTGESERFTEIQINRTYLCREGQGRLISTD